MEQDKLPRKTKIAARWLIIAGGIHLAICIIILVYIKGAPREPTGFLFDFSSLKWWLWDFGLPMGYLTIFYYLLGLELSDLPLWIIIAIPFVLPFLCIFFGASLLSKKEWIKKKSGYFLVMIVLLIYSLIILPSTALSLVGSCLSLLGLFSFQSPETELVFHFLFSLLTASVILVVFPPFILFYLDRKNFFRIVS